jgi:pimeloyl-ACP methyl ester carboxylesterase
MNHAILPPAPTGFAHRFATVNGLRFHYVTGGSEDHRVVVLLAGFPESWYAWRHVMPSLSERFRVVAIDLPGQGDTDHPLDGYDTQTLAQRIHGLIEHLGLRRYCLASHDVGAWVGFPYGLMFHSEIEALVLMDAGIPGITLPDMLPSAPDKAWKTWHFAFHAVPDLPELLIEGRERAYLEWFFRHKTFDPTCYGEEEIEEYLRIFRAPGGVRAGLAYYRAAGRSAEQNRSLTRDNKLRMPVLGLSADHGSIPDVAAAIAPFAANLRGETIANCGHFQPEEQPEAVADALSRFFDLCPSDNYGA